MQARTTPPHEAIIADLRSNLLFLHFIHVVSSTEEVTEQDVINYYRSFLQLQAESSENIPGGLTAAELDGFRSFVFNRGACLGDYTALQEFHLMNIMS